MTLPIIRLFFDSGKRPAAMAGLQLGDIVLDIENDLEAALVAGKDRRLRRRGLNTTAPGWATPRGDNGDRPVW